MQVKTLNKINSKGIAYLTQRGCEINTGKQPNLILVRSSEISANDLADELLVIARAGVGVNNIPIAELTKLGVPVLNTPGANATAVRDLVFGSLICFMRQLLPAVSNIDKTNIEKVEDIKKNYVGRELIGKTLFIIGLGAIGKLVAKTATGFGISVVAYDPFIKPAEINYCNNYGIKVVTDIAQGIKLADMVSVHIPFNKQTKDFINLPLLQFAQNRPIILNFSRAGIVDVAAITQALDDNLIAGYITDFPVVELLNKPNTLLLPHIGATTFETEEQCALVAAKNAWEYLRYGSITSSVNFPSMHLGPNINSRICCIHHDSPNILAEITGIIGSNDINIDALHNSARAGLAYTVIDIPKKIDLAKISKIGGMIRCRQI